MRQRALRRRYSGHARAGKLPGLDAWSTIAGGSYSLVFEGRTYSINPRFHDSRRPGGWSLRVSPAAEGGGLHAWIGKDGHHESSGAFPFERPASAVVAARKYAAKAGPEPHGIMKAWSDRDAKVEALMRSPEFWPRVERLLGKAVETGDTDLARVCRVALSERAVRPMGHDARQCALELMTPGGT
jgi:hypothetical protein